MSVIQMLQVSGRSRNIFKIASSLFVATWLAGCATAPSPQDREAVAEYEQINDPAEPAMRAIFEFNRGLDRYILKPIALVYKDYVPDPAKRGVYNFLNNLRSPVIFFNDILQGEPERAGDTLGRFVINSTVGLAGFGDPATDAGLAFHNEDFGQTLAIWGMPEGAYVVLPIFGPSNPRDAVGLAVDILVDPINWWASNTDNDWVPYTLAGTNAVDQRARNYDVIEDIERSSLDFYAATRSLYRQRRADEIANGKASNSGLAPGVGPVLP